MFLKKKRPYLKHIPNNQNGQDFGVTFVVVVVFYLSLFNYENYWKYQKSTSAFMSVCLHACLSACLAVSVYLSVCMCLWCVYVFVVCVVRGWILGRVYSLILQSTCGRGF